MLESVLYEFYLQGTSVGVKIYEEVFMKNGQLSGVLLSEDKGGTWFERPMT
jgi:hypothetical protein